MRWILTVCFALWAGVAGAQSYTETFYLCATGDGSAPEDGTCAHAFDAADFNTAGNWDTDDANDGKLGPNDRLVVLDDGGVYRSIFTVQQGGLSGKPIVIQGEANGTATIDGSILFGNGTSEGVTGNTNLHPHPEAAGSWAFFVEASTANNVTSPAAPNGTQTAEGLIATAVAGHHYGVDNYTSASPGTAYTFSIYVRAAAASWVEIEQNFLTSGLGYISGGATFVNLSTGAWGGQYGLTSRAITSAGNGWYRVSITATAPALTGVSTGLVRIAENDGDRDWSGDGTTEYVHVWGAKIEAAASVSAYENATVYYASADEWPEFVYQGTTRLVENTEKSLFVGQFYFDDANNRVYLRTTGDNAPSNYTIQVPQLPTTEVGLINFNQKSYVTIDGLTLQYSQHFAVSNYAAGADQTGFTVKNSTVGYTADGGIALYSDDYDFTTVVIDNNEIHHTNLELPQGAGALEGIGLMHADGVTISNNVVYNHQEEAIVPHDGCQDVAIYGNTVRDFAGSAALPGIYIGGCTNCLVYQNEVKGQRYPALPYAYGIGVSVENDAHPNTNISVYYNLIHDNDIGIQQNFLGTGDNTSLTFYNNTITNNNYGFGWDATASGNVAGTNAIKNNIFYNNSISDIIDSVAGDASIALYTISYNFFETGATTDTTGTNAVEAASPLMISASDFRLLPASTCLNAGTNVSLTTDYYGLPISGNPDIGAIEAEAGGYAKRFPLAQLRLTTTGNVVRYDGRH